MKLWKLGFYVSKNILYTHKLIEHVSPDQGLLIVTHVRVRVEICWNIEGLNDPKMFALAYDIDL